MKETETREIITVERTETKIPETTMEATTVRYSICDYINFMTICVLSFSILSEHKSSQFCITYVSIIFSLQVATTTEMTTEIRTAMTTRAMTMVTEMVCYLLLTYFYAPALDLNYFISAFHLITGNGNTGDNNGVDNGNDNDGNMNGSGETP